MTLEQARIHRRLLVTRSLATGEITMRAPLTETPDSMAGHLELHSIGKGSLLLVKGTTQVIYSCFSADLQPVRGTLDNYIYQWLSNPGFRNDRDQSIWQTEVFPVAASPSWIEKGFRANPQCIQEIRPVKASWDAWAHMISRCTIDERHHSIGRSIGDYDWGLIWGMDFDQDRLLTFRPSEEDSGRRRHGEWDRREGLLRVEELSILGNRKLRGRACLSIHRGNCRVLELPARPCDDYKAHQQVLFEGVNDPLAFLGVMEQYLVHFTPSSRRVTLLDFCTTW